MRTKCTMFLMTLTACVGFASAAHAGCVASTAPQPVLRLESREATYPAGHVVALKLTFVNTSDASMTFDNGPPDVWEGHIRVFVAADDQEFGEYRGPRWGLADHAGTRASLEIDPGSSVEAEFTVLYNHRIETSHLDEQAASLIARGQMRDAVAFARPGHYRIKAGLYDCEWTGMVESDVLTIEVTEPRAIDHEVWSVLAQNPDYAYFLQTGGPRGRLTAPQSLALVESLERVVAHFPGSAYAPAIRAGLSRYHGSLAELERRGLLRP